MNVRPTAISDVLLLTPGGSEDSCTWSRDEFRAVGIDAEFVQDNQSRSARGVVRGLHFQIEHAQGKLVRVASGAIFDVAVDLRRSSPTFGRAVTVELSAENRTQIWIPPGFAHGMMSLRDDTDVIYKCTDYYAPEFERTLAWNDPALGIDWPGDIAPILSPKDHAGTPLAEIETYP